MDIGDASTLLSQVLSKYNLQNLDEIFIQGEYTTSEFMAQQIFQDLVQLIQEKNVTFKGEICVKLWESHKAWACYRGLTP
jgi:6-pyruvoyltetrahydropterin/6-carboxytetrahydropterin synthase